MVKVFIYNNNILQIHKVMKHSVKCARKKRKKKKKKKDK